MQNEKTNLQQTRARIILFLRTLPDGFYWTNVGGLYGKPGMPDINLLYRGQYFGLMLREIETGVEAETAATTIAALLHAGGQAGFVRTPEDVGRLIGYQPDPEEEARRAQAAMDRMLSDWAIGAGDRVDGEKIDRLVTGLSAANRKALLKKYVYRETRGALPRELTAHIIRTLGLCAGKEEILYANKQ